MKISKKKLKDDIKKEENNKSNDEIVEIEKENKFPADNILGYLIIRGEFSHIIINIKGFGGYLYSIINNWKFWLILFINFFSRAQKLKFKTDFKKEFKEDFHLLSANFLFSYILYVFIIIIIRRIEKYKKRRNDNEIY